MIRQNNSYKTVTFFFSDIEGSTKLLQSLGDKYSNLLDEQRKILEGEFKEHDGEVSDISGDGFFVIFKTATDAVKCAVSIQQKIFSHKWAENSTVRIRMGIHTGEVKISDSGYTGIDIHRAARIMASGHGGQVLLSEASKVLVDKSLPSQTEIQFLGEYKLKDLQTPEKIYQLVINGLTSEFPLLRTSGSAKTNLPPTVTKLIGREKEIESLKKNIADPEVRLVTITGPGGMGKTTLSLKVCSSLINSFEDGVYVIYLSEINDTDLVSSTIGKVLGLSESNKVEHLVNFLGNKNLLLFLDNFEQLIEASEIINELISNCPRIKILITSRILLNIRAEKVFPLSSMTLPKEEDLDKPDKIKQFTAVQLFINRAKRVDRNFKFTNQNAEAIARICIRLDGLPLAIELACARIKLFTPETLLSKLNSKLSILKSTDTDLPERHQTLHQAIMWSYDLLSEEEKKLFEMMSVFSGGCSLDAIEKVCGEYFLSEIELYDSVQALIDKSLLNRSDRDSDEPRFYMLFTIRQFSKELLINSGDHKKIKDNHAYYYLSKSEEAEPYLTGKDIKYWLDKLDADIDNFRASLKWSEKDNNIELALRLCASLWRFWISRRNLIEGYEKMKYVLSMPYPDSLKQLKAKVLNGIGTILHEMNDFENALNIIQESVKIYRDAGDKQGELNSLINLLWVVIHFDEPEKGEKIAEDCLRINEVIKDERANSLIYSNLGWINLIRGNILEAKKFFLISLEKRNLINDTRGEGFAYTNLGWVEVLIGDYEKADVHLKKSIEILSSLSDKQLLGWSLSIYSFLEFYRGDLEAAELKVTESISLMKESLHEWSISFETLLYGIIKYYLNDKEKGIESIEKGLTFYRKIKNIWGMKRALVYLGTVSIDMGAVEKSKEYYKEALEISVRLKDKLGLINVFEGTAMLCIKNENTKQARMFYEMAAGLRKEIKAPMNYIERITHEENLVKLNIKEIESVNTEDAVKYAFEILERES